MTPSDRSGAAVSTAQSALLIAGGLWILGGLFLYGFVSPSKVDGVYWSMIDPISNEYAAVLQREARMCLSVGAIGGACHLAVAAVSRQRWGRWLLMVVGGLYCAGALPLAAGAIWDPSSALPVYALLAVILGSLLLNASRRPRTAVTAATPDRPRGSNAR
jgi:hypothetical protein